MNWIPLESDEIPAITYIDGHLYVYLAGSRKYVYYDVPPEIAETLYETDDKFSYYKRRIQNRYDCDEIKS